MFNEHTNKAVTDLINLEYDLAVKQYGKTYENHEQADDVLTEEVKEAWSEGAMLQASFSDWKRNDIYERAQDVYKYAFQTIKELAQVAAVARKIMSGYERKQEAAK